MIEENERKTKMINVHYQREGANVQLSQVKPLKLKAVEVESESGGDANGGD